MATNIFQIDPFNFQLEEYSTKDLNLIEKIPVVTSFDPLTDYIEYFIYNLNGSLVYPDPIDPLIPFTGYRIEDNQLILSPEIDLADYGYINGSYNTLYNFLTNRGNSSPTAKYFISEISTNRTELRLDSTTIPNAEIISSVDSFILERSLDPFFPDFYLNFGQNQLIISNNIAYMTLFHNNFN